jgi:hypothetical protein
MPYHKFTLDKIKNELNLQINEENLFNSIMDYPLEESFVKFLNKGIKLASAISTEKAKSEFIVAPLLLELKSLFYENISIFSGTELNVDKSKGLNGVCDFIIAKENQQYFLDTPIITLVEAKNDNISYGLAQCMAEMYAAQLYNQARQKNVPFIHGLVTTGNEWKFLRLNESIITIDTQSYFIDNLPKLFGILVALIKSS